MEGVVAVAEIVAAVEGTGQVLTSTSGVVELVPCAGRHAERVVSPHVITVVERAGSSLAVAADVVLMMAVGASSMLCGVSSMLAMPSS